MTTPDERAGQFSDNGFWSAFALCRESSGGGLATATPLDGNLGGMSIDRLEGHEKKPDDRPSADLNQISPGFFRTLGHTDSHGKRFRGV